MTCTAIITGFFFSTFVQVLFAQPDFENVNFGKTYTAVTFSPYVKNFVIDKNGGATLPLFNSYTLEEIKIMLGIISTKFNSIATYGMGVADYNVNNAWNETDSNCLIARAAAELNLETNNLTITVAQGVHQNPSPHVELREIENAFSAAEYANNVFPGTVWAIILMNQVIDPVNGKTLVERLKQRRNDTARLKIKIGPKIHNCGDVKLPRTRDILLELARESNFLMCNQHADALAASKGPKMAAEIVVKTFLEYRQIFKNENANVEVILGETGWPSRGRSRTGLTKENNINNTRIFWTNAAALSNKNQFSSYLFEAFDEPWKSDYHVPDPNRADGRHGAEGHFGWWRRVDNDDINSYVEKITQPEPDPELNPETEKDGQNFRERNPGSITGTIIGIVLGVLLLIVLPVIFYLVNRLRLAKTIIGRLSEREIDEFMKGIPKEDTEEGVQEDALLLPYDPSYEIPKNKLLIDKHRILGKGEFGMVYKGKIDGRDEDVAFKTVKSAESVTHLKSLLSELKIMIYIGKHDNVIGLLGAYTAELRDGIAYIAAEFCSLGSLEKHLRQYSSSTTEQTPLVQYTNVQPNVYVNTNESAHIPVRQLIKWSHQIACGMDWLANKKVIHADLATRNVLLTANKTVKITDFGLSRRLYEYTNYVKQSQEPLPWRWMALESLRSMNFSAQSDVWSYGVTLWEIFSMGAIPYPGLSWHMEFVKDLENGVRLTCPKYSTDHIYNKMMECWRQEPNQRPRFAELITFFQGLDSVESDVQHD